MSYAHKLKGFVCRTCRLVCNEGAQILLEQFSPWELLKHIKWVHTQR